MPELVVQPEAPLEVAIGTACVAGRIEEHARRSTRRCLPSSGPRSERRTRRADASGVSAAATSPVTRCQITSRERTTAGEEVLAGSIEHIDGLVDEVEDLLRVHGDAGRHAAGQHGDERQLAAGGEDVVAGLRR